VLFDCDGVVLQSNELKTTAFRDALEGENEALVDSFIDYHRRNGGVSRYIKFQYFYEVMKQDGQYERLANEAIERYGELVVKGLTEVQIVSGVEKLLEWLKARNVPCFLVSGGDEEELKGVFSVRGLDKYFMEILGSPKKKIDHVKGLVTREQLDCPTLFFGDARADMIAAEVVGADFCFVYGCTDWDEGRGVVEERGFSQYFDFTEIVNDQGLIAD